SLRDNPSTIVRISQISFGSSIRYVDELKRGKAAIKTIEEVAKSTEEYVVWIDGTITDVNGTKDSCYYTAGSKCKKKVT
ncbi:hypothetical protein PIB30_077529, partial [Stylosanthes scabra]|nr:hypothetical protein [Stylosanthes scabra]